MTKQQGKRDNNSMGAPSMTDKSVSPENDVPRENNFLMTPIEDFDFSVRTYCCLKRVNLDRVDLLTQKTASEIAEIRNFDGKCLREVFRALRNHGVSFLKEVFDIHKLRKVVQGFVIGDALGVPVEFETRKTLKENPVANFREYGTHKVPKGTWSDDTSMTLATLDSLTHGLNFDDMMQKFCAWMDRAEYTATGKVFDIGYTTQEALYRYKSGNTALNSGDADELSNGNGSLMRILPVAIFVKYKMPDATLSQKLDVIHKCSALTHAHIRSQIACGIYSYVVSRLLDCSSKHLIPEYLQEAYSYYSSSPEYKQELTHFSRLFSEDFSQLPESEIKSSGYVVHTLEAAIWSVMNATNYKEAVFTAVNLGEDTDTVAAITGGLAACTFDNVPEEMITPIIRVDYIYSLCASFYETLGIGIKRIHEIADMALCILQR